LKERKRGQGGEEERGEEGRTKRKGKGKEGKGKGRTQLYAHGPARGKAGSA